MNSYATHIILTAIATTMLYGCAVGPDFETPEAPDVPRYTDTDLPAATAAAKSPQGAAQTFLQGQDVPAQWWKLFGSAPLNALVEQALKANPDLKAASSALRQAKENYFATRGEIFPEVDATFEPTREKFNPSAFGLKGTPSSIFTLYDASVSVSYGIDVFGGTRRAIEASKAQEDYQRFEFNAAYLSLTANVVTAAIQEASLDQQIRETRNIIDIESKDLDILQKQFELGAIPKSTVLEQQAAVAQTQTSLPPLEKQLAQTRNQLAILAGNLPGKAPVAVFDLASLHLPENLPVSLPSKLVEQRPDIRAAEEQLHVASAEIGVATANMLPQLSITGNYGSESVRTGNLFSSGAEVWSIGGELLQPIFRGGELLHAKRAARAAFEKAAAQYQSTVLQAFKNVADTLRALQYDADTLVAQVNSEAAAHNSLDLIQTQFKLGAVTYTQLLDAQRTYQQARVGLVQAQAARLADTTALYQALGGNWDQPAAAKQTTLTSEKKP